MTEDKELIDLDTCPGCGGDADNGHDRCIPPSPYFCRRCSLIQELSYRACEDPGACSTEKGECGTCLVCQARALIRLQDLDLPPEAADEAYES